MKFLEPDIKLCIDHMRKKVDRILIGTDATERRKSSITYGKLF